jgi:hypothetical protein
MPAPTAALSTQAQETPNPFVWRSGIRQAEAFFNRKNEQATLRSLLLGSGTCQIVGPRRIGKTSLLLQVRRAASSWVGNAAVAYLDLLDARCETLTGWLQLVSRQFAWSPEATTPTAFSDSIETMIGQGRRPILCLDEFEQFTLRRSEFTQAFFANLRSCAGMGLSIVTASQQALHRLTAAGDPTSPFFNIFPVLSLGLFSDEDTADFVTITRPGVPSFTAEEKEAIRTFAQRHPLALQAACFHILEAKRSGDSLTAALRKAEADRQAMLPPESC